MTDFTIVWKRPNGAEHLYQSPNVTCVPMAKDPEVVHHVAFTDATGLDAKLADGTVTIKNSGGVVIKIVHPLGADAEKVIADAEVIN